MLVDPAWNSTINMIHRCAIRQARPEPPAITSASAVWACYHCHAQVDSRGTFAVFHLDVFHVACLEQYQRVHPELPRRYIITAEG